jgi:soluble P-type ATPase
MFVDIPYWNEIDIKYLVFDYNGTIAQDGIIIKDFVERVVKLKDLKVYVITADTYGTVRKQLEGSGIEVEIISKKSGSNDKKEFVERLGKEQVIAFGNGNNDRMMLEQAAVGICILGPEGASKKAMIAADMVVKSLGEALQLIEKPIRLIAGLRE